MKIIILTISILLLALMSMPSSAIIYFCYENSPKPTCSFTCEDGAYFSLHNQFGLEMCSSTATSYCNSHGGLIAFDFEPGLAALNCKEKMADGVDETIKTFHIKRKETPLKF